MLLLLAVVFRIRKCLLQNIYGKGRVILNNISDIGYLCYERDCPQNMVLVGPHLLDKSISTRHIEVAGISTLIQKMKAEERGPPTI